MKIAQSHSVLPKLWRLVNSVKFRLTLWYVAVLGLVLIVFAVVIYFILTGGLRSGLDDLLRDRAAQVSATFKGNVDTTATLDIGNENGVELRVEGEIILLFDAQGKLIQNFQHLNDTNTAILSQAAHISTSTPSFYNYKLTFPLASDGVAYYDYRIFTTPILADGLKVGTLVVGGSQEAVERTLHLLVLVLLVVAPLTLLVVAGGGYWLASRAMRPVEAINRAANEISETDLSRRLNMEGQNELSELAATFDSLLGRLDEAFQRQRQFTADASHELRTPLSIISLEAKRTLARPRTPAEYQETLRIIQSEGDYMTSLVGNLLTLARADAGQANLKMQELDLADLVLEVVDRLSALAGHKGLALNTGELPTLKIRGDQLYLTQMLTNLVENAIKYTSGYGSWVRVEIGTDQIGWAWLRVADNGCGIAPEHLSHLFDRFYRADTSRVHQYIQMTKLVNQESEETLGGSGLGLAIVKWVAQVHSGEVSIKSHLNKGSVFEVRLPTFRPGLQI